MLCNKYKMLPFCFQSKPLNPPHATVSEVYHEGGLKKKPIPPTKKPGSEIEHETIGP